MVEKSDKASWSQVENKIQAWVANTDPSVMVLYLPKATKKNPYPQIYSVGSQRLQPFVENEDVRKAFIDVVRSNSRPLVERHLTLKEGMPLLDLSILDSSMTWKRGKLSELVKEYMTRKKGMKGGYWGKECFKPEFWPRDLSFRPPSTNRAVDAKILTKDEMDQVLTAYVNWRSGFQLFSSQVSLDLRKCISECEFQDEDASLAEDASQEDATPEDAPPKVDTSPEDASPKDTSLKYSKEDTCTSPEDPSPKIAKKNTSPEDAFPKDESPRDAFPENASQEDASQEDTSQEDTSQEDATSAAKKEMHPKESDFVEGTAKMPSNDTNQDPQTFVREEMMKKNPDFKVLARTLGYSSWENFVDLCKYLHPFVHRPKREEINPDNVVTDHRFDDFVPTGYKAGKSLEQGDCLFSSFSMLLTGASDLLHDYLRIGSAVYGQIHLQHYFEKIIEQGIDNLGAAQMFLNSVCTDSTISKLPQKTTDFKEVILFALQEEVQITARPTCYSGPLQVMFLSGFLDLPIQQISSQNLPGYNDIVFPCKCSNEEQSYVDMLTILWLSFGGNASGHVVPLFKLRTGRARKEVKYFNFLESLTQPATTDCSTRLYGWCLNPTEDTMVQCERCLSWVHPSCFGIPTDLYQKRTSLPFFCCWKDTCYYSSFPDVRIGTTEFKVPVYLQDLISLRPGNWFTDIPLAVLNRHLNIEGKIVFFSHEEVQQTKKMSYSNLCDTAVCCTFMTRYCTTNSNDKMLVFKVGGSDPFIQSEAVRPKAADISKGPIYPETAFGWLMCHWWCVLYYRESIIILDSLKRTPDKDALSSFCSSLGLKYEDLCLSVADVPQQDNTFDCGAFTAAFMLTLHQFFENCSTMPASSEEIVSMFKTLRVNTTETRRDLKELLFSKMQAEKRSRKSNRRCQSELETERASIIRETIKTQSENGLKAVKIKGKGRGVVTTRPFKRGEFVTEYAGDLLSGKEAQKRDQDYGKDSSVGCYMIYFSHKDKKYCVDATAESGRMGRLVNHSKTAGNCVLKLIEIKNNPHLILIASRDIDTEEEVLYDYGDRNKHSLESHPWLKL